MDSHARSVKAEQAPGLGKPMWYDWQACLGEIDLFRQLSRKELKRVGELAEPRFYRDGRVIVKAGSSSDGGALCAIVEGSVRVETPSGHARVMETHESFGELGLLDGAPRSATVKAAKDVRLACIKGPAFRELLRREPEMANGVLRSLVAIVRDIQVELEEGATDVGRLPATGHPLQDEYGEDRSLPRDEAVRLLAALPLFEPLPKRHLRRIAAHAQLHTHPDGSLVVRKDARTAWYFHLVVRGSARLTTAVGTKLLGPGDHFGELALIDGAPRAAEVVAEGELTTLQISSTPFGELLQEEPAVTLGLIRGLMGMIREMQGALQ
jgi:CRP-like cAMP-binding protein